MPGLPGAGPRRRQLDAAYAGSTLAGFNLTFTALKTYKPDPVELVGQPLVFVGRQGKHLLLDFGTAPSSSTSCRAAASSPTPSSR